MEIFYTLHTNLLRLATTETTLPSTSLALPIRTSVTVFFWITIGDLALGLTVGANSKEIKK